MEQIYKKARAKVNLNLLIVNKREDGYHNIKSVFQKINLYDEIYVKKIKEKDFELITNVDEINNKENIIYKAYEKIHEIYNVSGIQVILNKNIPMQAGLAGGSTDCATFILCINKLFNLNLSKHEIESLGKSLGADVVPCLYNKAVLVEGIGEIITKINTKAKYYFLVIKPENSNNTKEMYKKIDNEKELKQFDNTEKIIEGLKNNDIKIIGENLYNVFEYVVSDKKSLKNIKDELIENGAIGSLMTGSGSCIFGIFDNKEIAKKSYKLLKNKYQIYMCSSYNSKRED